MIQARMSSSRFPGKMLAQLGGRPLIAHVVERVCESASPDLVVVITSNDASDDPLAAYVSSALGVTVFRGDLNDVLARFQACLRTHPCEWFVRISGDSPVVDPGLLDWMLARRSAEMDLLTNVAERTFPAGESIEIVRARSLLGIASADTTAGEREHVTQHFYHNRGRYRICSVTAADPSVGTRKLSVDTPEDLRTLERILQEDAGSTRGYAAHARLADMGG